MSRALLLLVLLTALSGCASWYYEPSIYQIRQDLPVGTPLPHVIVYLSQHQIEYTYYKHTNQIMTIVRNVRRDALVQPDRTLIFQFDAGESLVRIQEKPAYTAP